MRLTTTLPDYLRLAEITDDVEREKAWVDRYESAHPEIFTTYYTSWGRRDERGKAAREVPGLAPTLPAVEERARHLVEHAERSFRDTGLLDDDLDVVMLVGGHTSNGWVTDLFERPTLFLALEFFGDEPYDAVLTSHEAFHVAHVRHGAAAWPEDGASSLFQEGIAVAISRELLPGLPDSAYLWFDDVHAIWATECAAVSDALAARTLGLLDTSYDDPRVRALFTTREDDSGLPPRAGYWLGDLLVRRLLSRHPSNELLRWDHATARQALEEELSWMI